MLELTGNTVRLDMSNEEFGRPLSIAPDLYYGITSRFTLGIIHDVGNMVYEGYERYEMGLSILGPYLAHVHVKSAAPASFWLLVGC